MINFTNNVKQLKHLVKRCLEVQNPIYFLVQNYWKARSARSNDAMDLFPHLRPTALQWNILSWAKSDILGYSVRGDYLMSLRLFLSGDMCKKWNVPLSYKYFPGRLTDLLMQALLLVWPHFMCKIRIWECSYNLFCSCALQCLLWRMSKCVYTYIEINEWNFMA